MQPKTMIRPKDMVRPKAKLWPKTVIRPIAKLQPKAKLRPKAMVRTKAKLWPVAANVSYGADASNAAWVDIADANESNDGKFDFCQTMPSSSFPLFALS